MGAFAFTISSLEIKQDCSVTKNNNNYIFHHCDWFQTRRPSSSNQSINNQFHSSGGAVLLQVLLLTRTSTVVDDSGEQRRWRCFASRTDAHTHTLRASSTHQLGATPGAAHRKQELFYPLVSSLLLPCARRDEWNFLLRSRRWSGLRRRGESLLLSFGYFHSLLEPAVDVRAAAVRSGQIEELLWGFLFFLEGVSSTRTHSWAGSGSGTCQARKPQLVGRQAVRRTRL